MTIIKKHHNTIIGYANNKEEAIEMIIKKQNLSIYPYDNVIDWFNEGWHSYNQVYQFEEVHYGIE